MNLAVFVSHHGLGHSARVCAALTALSEVGECRAEIFTRAPRWFFAQSLAATPVRYRCHDVAVDVGLVQATSLREDLPATVRALKEFVDLVPSLVDRLAEAVVRAGCQAVLTDIAPLGVLVAERAQLPSVLLENFTWDWIYDAYVDEEPRMQPFADQFAELYARVDVHVQTEPVCSARETALRVGPMARPHRCGRSATRKALRVDDVTPIVLVSMGGIAWHYRNLDRLAELPTVHFVIAGDVDRAALGELPRNVTVQSNEHGPYHPDLVRAADLVVGKLGYSTVAEVLNAPTRLLSVERPRFPETAVIAKYLAGKAAHGTVSAAEFENGDWLSRVPTMLAKTSPDAVESGRSAFAAAMPAALEFSRGARRPCRREAP